MSARSEIGSLPTQHSKIGKECPICRAPEAGTIYSEVQDPITLERFRILACHCCGMAYTEGQLSDLDHYYPRKYRAYGWLVTRLLGSLYNIRVSRWSRLKPQGGSILEIGCGSGLMLAAFRRSGWRVLGLERTDEMAQLGRVRDLEILTVPVEKLSKSAFFDLIVIFNVLEHIDDPIALLRECASRLTPDGQLIIVVPNFSSWQSRIAGPKWFHLDVPRHVNHFTPETLRDALRRAGLRITDLNFSSPEHDPYGWIESTINMVTSHNNTLTRFLMGLDRFGPRTLLAFVLAAFLLPAAVILAVTSWVAERGALMEARAVVSSM